MLTIHRSKGLEFPIVYYPYLWEPGYIPDAACRSPSTTPTPATRARSTSGSRAPDFDRHKQQHLVEQRGEDLRLAYVALTRAQHQAVVWWAGSWDSRDSALGRLLFARDDEGTVAAGRARRRRPTPRRRTRLRGAGARRRRGASASSARALGLPTSWSGPPRAAGRAVGRAVRPRARLALAPDVVQRHHGGVLRGAGRERAGGDGRGRRAGVRRCGRRRRTATTALRATPSLLGGMPVGADVGTFVHRVLEATDFAAPRPRRRAGRARGRGRRRGARSTSAIRPRPWPGCARRSRRRSAGGLAAARRRARRPPRRARLRVPARRRRRADGAAVRSTRSPHVLREHLPAGDPLAGYADRLADPALRRSVRGYLTGSIDLVAPRPATAFAVVDYKTNWLGGAGRGADRLAPPPGRARRRDAARRTTGCRRCSTRSRCTATCAGGSPATTRSATSPACSTCSCAG